MRTPNGGGSTCATVAGFETQNGEVSCSSSLGLVGAIHDDPVGGRDPACVPCCRGRISCGRISRIRSAALRQRGVWAVAIERTSIVVSVVVLCLVVLAGPAGVAHADTPRANPPVPSVPQMPKGSSTRCTMSGPAWSAWGIHTPDAPPRRGNRYLVTSWGIPCGQAKALLRVFFPRVPAYSIGRLTGGPRGFACKGDGSGLLKNRLYAGSCVRLSPATMIYWEPVGGTVG